jgi:hypothetical protein
MTSEVILESIIYLVAIVVLHKIIKIYLLNVEHLFDTTDIAKYKEPFNNFNTTESWDELTTMQTWESTNSTDHVQIIAPTNIKYTEDIRPERPERQERQMRQEAPETNNTVSIQEHKTQPEPKHAELQADSEQNRLQILNDRFSMNAYNNCNLSNNNLNYANIQESELLSTGMNTLNQQFETYWSKTKDVKQTPTQSYDSIINMRNKEIQSYSNNTKPNQEDKEHNTNEANSDYLETVNSDLIQSTNSHFNNSNTSLQYNVVDDNEDDTRGHDVDKLELKPLNNSLELSDVRNTFCLDKDNKLTDTVPQIAAYDENTFLAMI